MKTPGYGAEAQASQQQARRKQTLVKYGYVLAGAARADGRALAKLLLKGGY